jgi:hypothetical protein
LVGSAVKILLHNLLELGFVVNDLLPDFKPLRCIVFTLVVLDELIEFLAVFNCLNRVLQCYIINYKGEFKRGDIVIFVEE